MKNGDYYDVSYAAAKLRDLARALLVACDRFPSSLTEEARLYVQQTAATRILDSDMLLLAENARTLGKDIFASKAESALGRPTARGTRSISEDQSG